MPTTIEAALPKSRFEIASLGIAFDPRIYPLRIRTIKDDTSLQMQTIMEETGLGIQKSRTLIRQKADQLKDTNLDPAKTYAVFYPLTPRTVAAITQVIDNQRQIRADKRMADKLIGWEDYFNNQAERDRKIAKEMQTVEWLLNGIKDSDYSDQRKKEEKEQILRNSLKNMRDLAPEQVLKSFLKPESYHPRKANKILMDTAIGRMDNDIKLGLTQRTQNNGAGPLNEELEKAKAQERKLSKVVLKQKDEIYRLEVQNIILESRLKNGDPEIKPEGIIEGKFRVVGDETYTNSVSY